MRLLVSVRDLDEALRAAHGGADVIDLKEPARGALGGLEPEAIARIVGGLREAGVALPVSATIGDWSMDQRRAIVARVHAVGQCGVDTVKVGIDAAEHAAGDLLAALADAPWPVAPVFIADRGLDMARVEHALVLGFAALMADTADKHRGSLFDCVAEPSLRDFVRRVRDGGAQAGLAGALRTHHVPALAALGPDFVGFRGALCAANRRDAALDGARVRALRAALARAPSQGAALGAGPSSSERMRASSEQ